MNSMENLDKNKKLNPKVWGKLLKYLLRNKLLFFTTLLFCLVIVVTEIEIITLVGTTGINQFGNFDALDVQEFILFLVKLFLLIALDVVGCKLYFNGCAKLEANLYRDLNNDMFDHLQSLSYSFYDKYSVGWLLARVTSDSENVGEIITWTVGDLFWGIFKLLFMLVRMMGLELAATGTVKLTFIMLIIVPVLLCFTILFQKIITKYFWKLRAINSQVTSALNEGINGAKTSKTLVLEEKNYKEFNDLSNTYRKTSIRSALFTSLYYQITAFICAIGIALMCYYGGLTSYNELIDPGLLFVFISYVTSFFEPVLSISRTLSELKHAQVSITRITNLLDVENDIYDSKEILEKYGTFDNPKYENWEKLEGNVEFENIDFYYDKESNKKILDGFNLSVKKGQTIALVGETGAGKTTIVNLLGRFYEPSSGVIKIDGTDYKERSLGWLHHNIGIVMQTPFLFSGSVMENIRFGNLDASDEDVYKAAKIVNAHDFITNELEKGYDTQVGEGGSLLSIGQRQLISFARAILTDPKILILDEATSSIDTETEAILQKAITKILKGRTCFVVAHRLSTIVNSDCILVISAGKIKEKGNHEELMKLKGSYYKLYTNQYIEDKLKEIGVK